NLGEAEASHRRAAEANPDHPDVHNHLGVALFRQKRAAEAIECYRRAIALKPDHAEAHNNLGTALQAQGSLDDAVESHRRAVAAVGRRPHWSRLCPATARTARRRGRELSARTGIEAR